MCTCCTQDIFVVSRAVHHYNCKNKWYVLLVMIELMISASNYVGLISSEVQLTITFSYDIGTVQMDTCEQLWCWCCAQKAATQRHRHVWCLGAKSCESNYILEKSDCPRMQLRLYLVKFVRLGFVSLKCINKVLTCDTSSDTFGYRPVAPIVSSITVAVSSAIFSLFLVQVCTLQGEAWKGV